MKTTTKHNARQENTHYAIACQLPKPIVPSPNIPHLALRVMASWCHLRPWKFHEEQTPQPCSESEHTYTTNEKRYPKRCRFTCVIKCCTECKFHWKIKMSGITEYVQNPFGVIKKKKQRQKTSLKLFIFKTIKNQFDFYVIFRKW